VRKLVARGIIKRDERVVGVLTGHLLKDTRTGMPQESAGPVVDASIDAVRELLTQALSDD
jgi:threonine synthase